MYIPAKGNARIDRIFPGVGRIRRSAETKDPDEKRELDDILTELYEDEQLESLRAFRDGLLAVAELREAKRKGRLTDEYLLERIKLERPLWTVIDEILPELGEAAATRERYEASAKKLRRFSGLGETAKVRDLRRVRWTRLKARWPGKTGRPPCSPSDWMRLRQFIGAFLTTYLGDVYHPFRRKVMKLIPRAKEKGRVVEITVEQFWEVLEHIPEHARPCYVVLAATGMRLGEYLACRKTDLNARALSVHIPGGKTGEDVVDVEEGLWPWIEAGIPAPIGKLWLRRYWHRACVATGLGRLVVAETGHPLDVRTIPSGSERRILRAMAEGSTLVRLAADGAVWEIRDRRGSVRFRARRPTIAALVGHGWITEQHAVTPIGRALAGKVLYEGIRLHDIRHMYGQVAIDEGAPESLVQAAYRHETPAMTRLYVRRKAKREVAEKVGKRLLRRRA
jgi:integrase